MDNRDWMYTAWRGKRDYDTEFIYKVDEFLKKAFQLGQSKAPCPCSKCENKLYQTKLKIGQHICNNGFVANYTRWICHGEARRARDEVVRQRIEEYDSNAGCGDMLDDFHQAHFDEGPSHVGEEPPEPTAKAYYDMLSSAQKPFHDHTDVSQLDAVGRLLALKCQLGISRDGFDDMLTVFGSLLPADHNLPRNMYESQKLLRALKMPYEQIHVCPKGCVLFRKEHVDEKYCPKCKSSRFLEVDSGDGHKRQLKIPVKILRYLPFIPRIQRLYMTEETAKQMTWHKEGIRYRPENMVHPADAESWKYFDSQHPDEAADARNVRVALATDGFNPYGMSAAPYTCWPVFVIPLNLPPGVMFKRQTIFLSLIIPGHPGNNMSVYMEPLIDDLLNAWNVGVWTYDRATKRNFKMKVWYMYSMHDHPAYGLFSGWCVHGKFPCPVCKSAVKFFWLKKGGKYVSFDKHRQFLPMDHPFRQDIKNFTKGVVVEDPPPQILTGAAVHEQLNALKENEGGGFVGYGEEHAWTQKSGLWRLPYMVDILLPHIIDMMHTEKNIAEALWCTIMDILGKTKDNVKARVDQTELCSRPKLDIPPPKDGKRWKKPPADFVLKRNQRKEVLEWLKTLMFPDGYAANWRRGVNLGTMRVNGLKSHDYHIWIERLLTPMVRGYLPDHVWLVLAEVSYFFRTLCAKELPRSVIAEMEKMAPVLLCKLEKIFPPSFFNPMEHMILHLPYEARMCGPVHSRWCYSIERQLKVLRTKCKSKCKIEASMAEAYCTEEVSNFTTKYYADILPSVHNPLPRYNANENECNLSLFVGQLGSASGGTAKTLQHAEFRTIMMYVLTNLSEVQPYFE